VKEAEKKGGNGGGAKGMGEGRQNGAGEEKQVKE